MVGLDGSFSGVGCKVHGDDRSLAPLVRSGPGACVPAIESIYYARAEGLRDTIPAATQFECAFLRNEFEADFEGVLKPTRFRRLSVLDCWKIILQEIRIRP